MARRRSPWKELVEGFKAGYETVGDVITGYEVSKATNADYTDDEGKPLSGDALQMARYNAIADAYLRGGKPEDALAYSTQVANLRGKKLDNRFAEDTYGDRRDYVSKRVENLDATTGRTRQSIYQEGQLFPGRLDQQRIDIAQRQQAYEFDKQANPVRLYGLQASNRNKDVSYNLNQQQYNYNASVFPSRRDAAIAENKAAAARSAYNSIVLDQQRNEFGALDQINRDVMGAGYETPEEASAAFLKAVENSPDLSMKTRQETAKFLRDYGYGKLNSEALQFTQSVTNALNKGGLTSGLKEWDKWVDGYSNAEYRAVERKDASGRVVTTHVVVAENAMGEDEVVFQADSENELKAIVQGASKDWATAMQVSASSLRNKDLAAYNKARSEALATLASDTEFLRLSPTERQDTVASVSSTLAAAHPAARGLPAITIDEVQSYVEGQERAKNPLGVQLAPGWTVRTRGGDGGAPGAENPPVVQASTSGNNRSSGNAGFNEGLQRSALRKELADVEAKIATLAAARGNAARAARPKLLELRRQKAELESRLTAAGPGLQGE